MKTRRRKGTGTEDHCRSSAEQAENAALVPLPATVQGNDPAPMPAPVMTPAVNAAYTLARWSDSGESNIDALIVGLAAQGKALRQGDLTDAERMLMAHASTLDVIFNQLARRAALSVDQSLGACDAYLRLALKAQSQCRATLETLSLIKNPRPVSFVRQANIANGPQQVNNGTLPPIRRTRETENQPIELLEQTSHVSLDTRTSQAASGANSAMATVGEVHRATVE
jgi:hypothetical protein